MRSVLGALVAMLLTSPLQLQAGQATLGTCAASVGAWEFIEGGRAVIAREGDRYHAVWLTTFVNTNGATQREGVAAGCTCQDAPNKLVWKCRVAYSFDSSQVGAEQSFEWSVDGDTLTSWFIAPDGTRSATALRRARSHARVSAETTPRSAARAASSLPSRTLSAALFGRLCGLEGRRMTRRPLRVTDANPCRA